MYSIELQTIFYEYQNKNPKINTSFVTPGLRPLTADKSGFNLMIFTFNIRGKLSMIRCDRYILSYKIFFSTNKVFREGRRGSQKSAE